MGQGWIKKLPLVILEREPSSMWSLVLEWLPRSTSRVNRLLTAPMCGLGHILDGKQNWINIRNSVCRLFKVHLSIWRKFEGLPYHHLLFPDDEIGKHQYWHLLKFLRQWRNWLKRNALKTRHRLMITPSVRTRPVAPWKYTALTSEKMVENILL